MLTVILGGRDTSQVTKSVFVFIEAHIVVGKQADDKHS